MTKITTTVMLLVAVCAGATVVAQDSVIVEQVIGSNPHNQSQLRAGVPIEFSVRFSHQSAGVAVAWQNGIRITTPDGATWDEFTFTENPAFFSLWDFGHELKYNNNYGNWDDTIRAWGWRLFQPGLPQGYDSWVFSLHTELPESSMGKTVCLDSTWFPADVPWVWTIGSSNIIPEWSGPLCYEVVPCCVGIRGNSDNSQVDFPMNILDLDWIINWMFQSGPSPQCYDEADVDASSEVDISDVSYIVDYLFGGGPEPLPCP